MPIEKTLFLREYGNFLDYWSDVAHVEGKVSYEEAVSPVAGEIFEKGRNVAVLIESALGFPVSLGGSSLMIDGKSSLNKRDRYDCDLRVWINSEDEFLRASDFIRETFPIETEKDQSDKDDIVGTGAPARLFIWHELTEQYELAYEIQVRKESTGGYKGIGQNRLETLDLQLLGRYLAVKTELGKLPGEAGKTVYEQFKSIEKKFWTLPDPIIEAILGFHENNGFATGGTPTSTRLNGDSQSEHMARAALKAISLGGGWDDFITAFLHDCIEEAHDRELGLSSLERFCSDVFGEEKGPDYVRRVIALTEIPLTAEEKAGSVEKYGQRLRIFCSDVNITPSPDEQLYFPTYFSKYTRFIAVLEARRESIRIAELADRWDGLESSGYLLGKSKLHRLFSLARVNATFTALTAPDFLIKLLKEVAMSSDIPFEAIEKGSDFFRS